MKSYVALPICAILKLRHSEQLLTLRRVMDTAKHATKSGNLNEFSMVMLNNTLSLPLGLVLIFVFNEVDHLSRT
ncbi:GDP-MANNOSE TRANSPORTER 1-RELATED, partial [Salix koriyanagi]